MKQWISRGLIILIGLFSLTTIGNVAYFVEKLHEGFVGYTLGMALGTALFLTAYIAATTESEKTKKISLTCAALFGLTSAYFQFSVYSEHAETFRETINAFLLAFVPIVVGEAGLALLESSISVDEETKEIEKQEVADLQAENDELSSQLSAEIRKRMDVEAEAETLRKEISQAKISTPETKRKPKISSKKISMNDRRNSIAEILKEQHGGKGKDEVEKPEIKKELAGIFDVTDKTIGTDIAAIWEERNWNGSVGV